LQDLTTLAGLHDKINTVMSERPTRLIGIDGMDGIGKTWLAGKLAELLGATVISLDKYVDKKQGAYVPHIRCQDVKAAIEASSAPVIVEGVCLRAVAERCVFTIDVHVYVRRISKNSGLWHDDRICLAESPVDVLKRDERELRRAGAALSGREDLEEAEKETGLRDELIEYHAHWHPVPMADMIFTIAL
jgi:hypothetical protein